jgi:hypothetical protein
MTREISPEWIIGLYDNAGDDGQEHKTAELREVIKPDVMAILAEMPRDLETEAELLINMAISPTRKSRRNSLQKDLEYLVDSLFEEDGSYVEPILERVVPLGTNDGLDKKLRYWEVDDFSKSVKTAYRQAAEQTAAAYAFDSSAQRVINAMTTSGAITFGDLWT